MIQEHRLIDAKKALRVICKECAMEFPNEPCEPTECFIRKAIEKTRTETYVEVVHGRWIAVPSSDMMTGKAYKCSECNKMRYGSFMPNYCQNCGAKMDGDGNG